MILEDMLCLKHLIIAHLTFNAWVSLLPFVVSVSLFVVWAACRGPKWNHSLQRTAAFVLLHIIHMYCKKRLLLPGVWWKGQDSVGFRTLLARSLFGPNVRPPRSNQTGDTVANFMLARVS